MPISLLWATACARLKYGDPTIYLIIAGILIAIGLTLPEIQHKFNIGPLAWNSEPSPASQHSSVVSPTVFCRYCGAKIPRTSKFCEECGSKLT